MHIESSFDPKFASFVIIADEFWSKWLCTITVEYSTIILWVLWVRRDVQRSWEKHNKPFDNNGSRQSPEGNNSRISYERILESKARRRGWPNFEMLKPRVYVFEVGFVLCMEKKIVDDSGVAFTGFVFEIDFVLNLYFASNYYLLITSTYKNNIYDRFTKINI